MTAPQTPTPGVPPSAESVQAMFGLDPDATGKRPRSWRIVDAGESNDLKGFSGMDVPEGSLAVHTRDGASNPICPEACRKPNFLGTVEDDYDRTYRDYFYAPLSSLTTPSDEGEEDPFDGLDEQIAAIQASPEYATESIAAEAYQVIGTIASAGGLFDHPDVQRALDYFSGDREGEILPFAMSTTPASGSDGLETVEDVLFYKLKDLILEQSEGEWDDATIIRDAHHFANHLRPLVTREAAEKRIGEEKARADRAAARMHKAIDKAREEEVAAQAAELRADQAESQVAALKAALVDARETLDAFDCALTSDRPVAGAARKAVRRIDQALALKEGR